MRPSEHMRDHQHSTPTAAIHLMTNRLTWADAHGTSDDGASSVGHCGSTQNAVVGSIAEGCRESGRVSAQSASVYDLTPEYGHNKMEAHAPHPDTA